jgi:hypothetical protein
VKRGYADLVATVSRTSQSDLVERFEHNLALAEADVDTFYAEAQKDILSNASE